MKFSVDEMPTGQMIVHFIITVAAQYSMELLVSI